MPDDVPDYSKTPTPVLCRLFEADLGPEGLARLAELEAQARPPKSRRKRADLAKGAVLALKRLAKDIASLGWSAVLPAVMWAADRAAKIRAGERAEALRVERAEGADQGGLFG